MSSLKPPRHISTYMKARLSRGVSAVFGDLDSSCFRIGGSGQAPQPRSGAPKAQGLRAPSYPKHHRRDRKYFLVKDLLRLVLFSIQGEPFASVQLSRHKLISGRA